MNVPRIGDNNWRHVRRECGVLPRYVGYGSAEALAQGLIPVGNYPDKLVPKEQWQERIEECNAKKMFPIHYFEANKVPAKNQNPTNYCWAYSLASVVEAVELMQAQQYRRLAPATLGWLVRWRNQGFWLSDALKGALTRGISEHEYCADGQIPRRLSEEAVANALHHRPLEWFDTIGPAGGDEEEHVAQCVSLLLSPSPGYHAHNWWGHALMMAGLEWDDTQRHNLRWVNWNSHGDGRIELTGSKGVPDEFYSPRSVAFTS